MPAILALILLQLIHGCSFIYRAKAAQPKVAQGEIDLRSWNFEVDGPVWLDGDWFFFPNKVELRSINNELLAKTQVASNKQSRPDRNNPDLPWFGMSTWVIRVKLPPNMQHIYLKTSVSWFAFNSYAVSGQKIQAIKNDPIDSYNTVDGAKDHGEKISAIEIRGGETLIVFYLDASKSFGVIPVAMLGGNTELLQSVSLDWAERSFLLGAYFFLAFICFALFMQRRAEFIYLYASLVCFGMGVRFLGTELALSIFGLTSTIRLSSFCMYLGTNLTLAGLLMILMALTDSIKIKKYLLYLKFSTIFLVILAMIVHSNAKILETTASFQKTSTLIWVWIACLNCLILFQIFKTVQRIRSWSLYLGVGAALYLLGLIWDMFVVVSSANLIYIAHYSNLVFCISITLMIGRRFAMTYAENERLLAEVKEKERFRTVFFHNTSHELRTPLNGIIGFLQLLNQGRYGPIPDAGVIQVQKCIRLALSLKNQVNTILDLAKSKRGMLTLRNSMFRLEDLVVEAEDLAAGLQLRGLGCSFHFESHWDEKDNLFVNDREKISTLLRNLLGNAFKFSDVKRPNKVELIIKRQGNNLLIEVSDTGIGIAADQRDHIFEEFQQVSVDAARAFEGTGLGLTMVRDIVRLMQGTIQVESIVGKGSQFKLVIPAQKEIELQHTAHIGQASQQRIDNFRNLQILQGIQPNPPPQDAAHILVVDDHELNCELLRDLLAEASYKVSMAMGGAEALEKMRSACPDLVLLDLMMPFVSGEDVMKAMQKDIRLSDIPVILVTARASEDDRLFGLSLGADDYLAKPLHHEELVFRVQNILRRKKMSQKSAGLEDQERLQQLRQLLGELSHGLKNVFQRDIRSREEDKQCGLRIIRNLPIKGDAWNLAAADWIEGKMIPPTRIEIGDLKFSDKIQSQSRPLRYLRAAIAQLDMQDQQRQSLWNEILQLNPEQQENCDQTLHLVRSFLEIKEQSLFAKELVFNILDFSRHGEADEDCLISVTIPRVIKLIEPRLQRLDIKLGLDLEAWNLRISSSSLMQVAINLLSFASHSLEKLPREKRWIRIDCINQGGMDSLCFSWGSPQLNREQVATLFVASWSENSAGTFNLSVSQRILERVSGKLIWDESALHPTCLVSLNKALSKAVALVV